MATVNALTIAMVFAKIEICISMCSYSDLFENAYVLMNQNAVWFNEDTLLRENIYTHLDKCIYLRMDGLKTPLLCRQVCAVTETCLAYVFGSDYTCDICVTKIVRSSMIEHPLSEVYVDLMKGNLIKG